MEQAIPITKELVLVGGGHSHVAVLKSFGMNPIPGVRLTLISCTYDTPYSGMLPGYLAGHYCFEESHINLIPLCRFAQAQFYRDTVVGVDLSAQRLRCENHPPVSFDVVSFDTGSTPAMATVPGAEKHAVPVKPVDAFLKRWREIEPNLRSNPQKAQRIMVVGGGAGGVELCLSLDHRLNRAPGQQEQPRIPLTLITATDEILATHNQKVRSSYRETLRNRNIEVLAGIRVSAVEPNRILTEASKEYAYDHLFWVTTAAAPSWPQEAGLDVDPQGFIKVNDSLQSTSHPFVFAAGDIATMENHRRPKSGVFAVRQGPPLTQNLRNMLRDIGLVQYRPQSRFLSLISTGDQNAIASRGSWALQGNWVWRWKDWIDRRFMRQYQDLPQMKSETGSRQSHPPLNRPPDYNPIRCTGCGSKVGQNVLTSVLKRLTLAQDSSIQIGLNEPDDAAVFRPLPGQSVVQTVDYFPAFLNDPWLFAQIATIHCLSDVIAMGGTPHSAQIIATLPYGSEDPSREILYQTLSGAVKVLDEHKTSLIGGHTLEGPQLAFGMVVNGHVNEAALFRKSGLQPGDQLILTKPLGTGLILASLMQGSDPSSWLDSAIQTMLQSNASAIPILRNHQVTCATDITGFGLIGHLHELLSASRVSADLWLNQLPILPGAKECAAAGRLSSLHPENYRFKTALTNAAEHQGHKAFLPLFDPQTAGGLCFGVREEEATNCLQALQTMGWSQAAIIGQVSGHATSEQRIKLTNSKQ